MKQVLGAILMAVGILMGGTAGLCGGVVLVLGSQSGASFVGSDMVVLASWIGAPLLIGAGLVVVGFYIQRSDRGG